MVRRTRKKPRRTHPQERRQQQINTLQFKKRTCTDWLYIIKKPLNGATKENLVSAARRLGEFDTGYHYIIQSDGTIETDRDNEAVAQWDFPDNTTSIYILCDTTGSLTDAQRIAVSDLFKNLVAQYPHIQTVEVN
jgi:N-acetyl-anhydromuramyl-L-alanine amidase AmpD|nr:MAG TPA: lysozyme [Bacteriophage sp.]